MRTAKLTLALLIGLAAVTGPVNAAQAASRSANSSSSASVFAAGNEFWCSGDTCTCVGDADCNDMFGRFDCAADWERDILGVTVGTCKFPTPRPQEVPDPDPSDDPRLPVLPGSRTEVLAGRGVTTQDEEGDEPPEVTDGEDIDGADEAEVDEDGDETPEPPRDHAGRGPLVLIGGESVAAF